MCGLNDQVSDSIGCRPGQSLTGIVDGDPILVFYAAYNRLVGKAAADRVFWKCLFHCGLNGADGQAAFIWITGTDADDKQLVLTGNVLISGIVCWHLAGVHSRFLLCFAAGLCAIDTGYENKQRILLESAAFETTDRQERIACARLCRVIFPHACELPERIGR